MNIVQTCRDHVNFIVRESWEKRNDLTLIEKTSSITIAAIQLWNATHLSQSLMKLSSTLKLLNCQYFFNIAQQPLYWFPCISAHKIDSYETLNSLTDLLMRQLQSPGQQDTENPHPAPVAISRNHAEIIARFYLQKQLQSMEKNLDTFRTAADFNQALKNRMEKDQRIAIGLVNNLPNVLYRPKNTNDPSPSYDLTALNLTNLQVHVVKTHVFSLVGAITSLFIDLLNVTHFLKSWNILDIAKWSQSIGQLRVSGKAPLSFVETISLETIYKGSLSLFLLLKFLATCVEGWRLNPSAQNQKKRLWCQGVATGVDLVYQGTYYLNQIGITVVPKAPLLCLSIFSKTVGIISILYMPNIQHCEVS